MARRHGRPAHLLSARENPAALWCLSNLVIRQTGWMEIPARNNESHPPRAFHKPAAHSSAPDKGIRLTAAAAPTHTHTHTDSGGVSSVGSPRWGLETARGNLKFPKSWNLKNTAQPGFAGDTGESLGAKKTVAISSHCVLVLKDARRWNRVCSDRTRRGLVLCLLVTVPIPEGGDRKSVV